MENYNKNKNYFTPKGNRDNNNRYDNRGKNDMNDHPDVEIRAPFNFVPVAESVFHPYVSSDDQDESYQISQDVPFEDGTSGEIKFKFTAQTPIFTKNSDNENISSFNYIIDSNGKKQYFIPASSIKGCVRNVLEIMSFGKMSKVDKKSFGLRDLNNSAYRSQIKDVHCGWMEIRDDEKAYIEDWGTPGRISIDAIATEYNVPALSEMLNIDTFKKITRGKDNRDKVTSPLYKYNLLKGKELTNRFTQRKVDKGRVIYRFDKKGKEGTIVLTGQSSGREEKKQYDGKKKWVGKIYEFIFFKPKFEPDPLKVSVNVLKAFRTIHENSPAYTSMWSEKLKKGEKIPVFFMLNGKGEITSIGLAYMYKYPYSKDTYNAIPGAMFKNGLDLAESMFGYTESEKKLAMRGRVQFSHAMTVSNNVKPMDEIREFPAYSPHSSYYPIYVKDGKDWDNAKSIAGWKRYLVQSEPIYKAGNKHPAEKKNGMEDKIKTTTAAKFLPSGTQFEVSVRFHNLRPFELGALLSAITFHGNNGKCFHSIGFGKAYGYGKIKIDNPVLYTLEYTDSGSVLKMANGYEAYLKCYRVQMESFKENWIDSDQMKQLLAIAGGWNKNVGYMSLEEYRNAKKNKKEKHLKPFTELNPNHFKISLTTPPSTSSTPQSSSAGTFTVGQEVIAKCEEAGKVRLKGQNYLTTLGLKKDVKPKSLVGKTLKVRVNQVSNQGVVTHVSFISVAL